MMVNAAMPLASSPAQARPCLLRRPAMCIVPRGSRRTAVCVADQSKDQSTKLPAKMSEAAIPVTFAVNRKVRFISNVAASGRLVLLPVLPFCLHRGMQRFCVNVAGRH